MALCYFTLVSVYIFSKGSTMILKIVHHNHKKRPFFATELTIIFPFLFLNGSQRGVFM